MRSRNYQKSGQRAVVKLVAEASAGLSERFSALSTGVNFLATLLLSPTHIRDQRTPTHVIFGAMFGGVRLQLGTQRISHTSACTIFVTCQQIRDVCRSSRRKKGVVATLSIYTPPDYSNSLARGLARRVLASKASVRASGESAKGSVSVSALKPHRTKRSLFAG